MDELLEYIVYEKEWREKELDLLLKIVISEKNEVEALEASEETLNVLTKYFVPAIYAIWEGFIKDSLVHYSSFINRYPHFEKDIVLITQIVNHKKILKTNYKSFGDKKDTLNNINRVFNNPFMPEERPISKILDFTNSNNLLCKFNLKKLNKKHHPKLNKLIKARNSFAHGEEKPAPTPCNDIKEYVLLVKGLMNEIYLNIENIVEQQHIIYWSNNLIEYYLL